MTDWRATSLGEICKFQAGDAFPKELQGAATGDVPVVKVSDMNLSGNELFISYANNWLSRSAVARDFKLHPAGAVIFAKIGVALTSNRRRILIRPTVIDNNMMSAVCTSGIDPRWFYYLLTTLDFNEVASGSALPYLTVRDLNRIAVSLPSLPEQRAIAATLGVLDDKIELNRKMNATLESMARALFRDWFVDFGPTRAKMAGREPYLSAELWSLFPDRLDDEGKPKGWEERPLSDLATLNPESWSAKRAPAAVRYVDLANTKWGNIDKIEEYDWTDAPSRARRILRPGDTIVGTVRPGNGSFAHIGEDGLTGSTGFAVLRPNDPRDRGFVWCAATSPENIDRLAHLADGGAYPAVRPDAVAGTEIVIPDAPILAAFDEIGRAHLDMMEANKRESRTLARTRDLLLPRLMSGELRVAGAETLASKVA